MAARPECFTGGPRQQARAIVAHGKALDDIVVALELANAIVRVAGIPEADDLKRRVR